MSPSANGQHIRNLGPPACSASSRSGQKWGPMKWWCTWFGARFSASPHISSPTRRPARRQVPLGLPSAGCSWHSPWLSVVAPSCWDAGSPGPKDLVDLHGRRVSGRGCQKQAAIPGVASPCKRGTGVDQLPNLVAYVVQTGPNLQICYRLLQGLSYKIIKDPNANMKDMCLPYLIHERCPSCPRIVTNETQSLLR